MFSSPVLQNDEARKALHGAQMSVLQPYIPRGDIQGARRAIPKTGCLPSLPFTLKAIESSEGKSLPCSLPMTTRRRPRFRPSRTYLAGKVPVSGAKMRFSLSYCIAQARNHDRHKPVTNEAVRSRRETVRLPRAKSRTQMPQRSNGKTNCPPIMLKPWSDQGQYQGHRGQRRFQTLKRINQALSETSRFK